MKKLLSIFVATAMLVGCATQSATDYAAKVNPKIGSGGHGHVFVGANVPFGMTQVALLLFYQNLNKIFPKYT